MDAPEEHDFDLDAVLAPDASLARRITLRQLQCLCSVVDAGYNLSRAADALHVTHTVVGTQLRQLERELGAPLLVREAGRVAGLSPAGERSLPWARRVVHCIGKIRMTAHEGVDITDNAIVLATSHTYANYVLPPALISFTQSYPKVSIQVIQGVSNQVAELVRQGKVTIGVADLLDDLCNEVVAIPFQSMRQVLIAPCAHPVLERSDLTLAVIADHPMVVLQGPGLQKAPNLHAFELAGLDVRVTAEALDVGVVKALVAAGLGIAVIPEAAYFPARDNKLQARDAGHLFEPLVCAVLLRRHEPLRKHVGTLLSLLNTMLDAKQLHKVISA